MRRLLKAIMNHRPTKAYSVEGELLFYRAYLCTIFGWRLYLHHYLRSDPDERGLHNHPAKNWSMILAGGYDEERIVGYGRHGPIYELRRRNPGTIYRIDEQVFHRLIVDLDTLEPVLQGASPLEPVDMRTFWHSATSWSLFASKYIQGKSWGFMSSERSAVEGRSIMVYREAGDGIDEENPWWETALPGHAVADGRR